MIDNQIEVRNIELRASTDPTSRKIHGTAIVFNQLSQPLGKEGEFREIIKPEAITQELINTSDIVLLYNHNQDSGVLARSRNGKGSLKITLTPTGVDFDFVAKKTALGDEVLESVRNGDLSACSFAFRKAVAGDFYTKQADGTYIRTITSIDLLKDFSIVVDPAYNQTSVDVRGLIEFKSLENNSDMVVSGTTENQCDMCDKCDLLSAKIDKVLELIQSMIVEDAIEDAVETIAETLEPVEATTEQVDQPATEPVEQDSCDAEKRDLEEYYNNLKISIRSIKIE